MASPVFASARFSPLQWSTQIDFSPTMLCIWHWSESQRVGGMFLVLRWSGSIRPVAIWLRWLAGFGGWLALVAGWLWWLADFGSGSGRRYSSGCPFMTSVARTYEVSLQPHLQDPVKSQPSHNPTQGRRSSSHIGAQPLPRTLSYPQLPHLPLLQASGHGIPKESAPERAKSPH